MTRRRKQATAIAAALLLGLWVLVRGCSPNEGPWSRAQVLDAIRFVESGWRENVPDGDDGKAIGPYQIHEVYWRDAITFRPELGGRYEDCRRRAYAERVIEAFMQKWVPDAWEQVDAEVLARTHNGGPTGADKDATLRYWERVRAALH